MMSCTCFEPEGSSSGRRLYIQVWCSMLTHTYIYKTAYTAACTTYYTILVYTASCLPEGEPSGSKHVEDAIN